jgi:hypothetical protein
VNCTLTSLQTLTAPCPTIGNEAQSVAAEIVTRKREEQGFSTADLRELEAASARDDIHGSA